MCVVVSTHKIILVWRINHSRKQTTVTSNPNLDNVQDNIQQPQAAARL